MGRISASCGGVEELSRDLAKHKSVRESVAAWEKKIKRLSLLRDGLSGEVNALEKRRADVQGAVTALSKAGVAEITATKEAALSGVRDIIVELRNEAKAHTELKVEAVRLERELICARYLAASDQALSKTPMSAAEVLLRTLTRHCRARGVNPRVPIPDSIRREGCFYSYHDVIGLLDLFDWVRTGLASANTEENQRVGGGLGSEVFPRRSRLTPNA